MKTILITGSTDGIGKITAIKLAKDGHQMLIHGRNSEKLKQTISEIKTISNTKNVNGLVADLSDFGSIQKMVAKLVNEYSKIDVLINNAGVYNSLNQTNNNDLDMRFAVNYFAPYILSNSIRSLLQKSSSPRVINLSSAAQSNVSFEALHGTEELTVQTAYAQSKLALTMWSFYFAKKNPEICTIAVNPGSLLNTKMVQEAFGQHWSSADKGADILYDLAISIKYLNSSGAYFDNDKGSFNKAHSDAYNQEKITRLISETEKILSN